ncbi:MAG: DUF1573 domain-containing protein [Candidatus Cloacimonetes bacterium]|nr:DUF1573 domain-containing protein [Candidatus Cloacimonadota bacterium]
MVLRVNGFIIPDESVLRKRIGQLKMNRAEVNFGNVYDTAIKFDTLLVRNESGHEMELEFDKSVLPANLSLSMSESLIKPGETSTILTSVSGDKEGKYGFNQYRVNFIDKAYPDSTKGQLIITFSQLEDFGSWKNEDKSKAPRIDFFNKTCDFGSKLQGEKGECEFRFENKGKSALKIRDIRLPSHVSILRYDEVVEVNGTGVILLDVDTSRITGTLLRYVNVTTNCPTATTVRLTIEGEVIEK